MHVRDRQRAGRRTHAATLHDSQSDYDRIARDMPDVYKFGYDATDANAAAGLMERGLQAMLYDAMRSVLHDQQPDAIISTYPLYQPRWARCSRSRRNSSRW